MCGDGVARTGARVMPARPALWLLAVAGLGGLPVAGGQTGAGKVGLTADEVGKPVCACTALSLASRWIYHR